MEGKIFDVYSPGYGTSPRNIFGAIKEKVMSGQTTRVVLNLNESNVSLPRLIAELTRRRGEARPLDEVLAIRRGSSRAFTLEQRSILVAIEFQIKGDFALDRDLEQVLRDVLEPTAGRLPAANEHIVFALADSEISVTALQIPGEEHESVLFFRVLDKGRVVEAEKKIVTALDAVLRATEGPLQFFFSGERLLLERTRGEVRLIGHGRPPRDDFWIDAHAGLLHGPVVLVQRKVPPKRR